MKKFYRIFVIGLLIAVIQATLFSVENEVNTQLVANLIGEKISEYLSTHSLYPYINPGKNEFVIKDFLEPAIENDKSGTLFVEVNFGQEKSDLKGMFLAYFDKASKTMSVYLLCLSDSDLMSPTLFFDVWNYPALRVSCPEGTKMLRENNGYIFIASKEINNGDRHQVWTFFNSENSYQVPITLQDDGKGGSHFLIETPKK